tara:strand:- start:60 stop:1352 length:1293 start_codon:yes stop_codon:yes gene_type:complete
MSLIHIEGFDAVTGTTIAGYAGLDMAFQAKKALANSPHSDTYTVDPDPLTEFAPASGRYDSGGALKLYFKQHTARRERTEDGVATSTLGNTGTWTRMPISRQFDIESFVLGFSYKKTVDGNSSNGIISVVDSAGDPLFILGVNSSKKLILYVPNHSSATYANVFEDGTNAPSGKQKNYLKTSFIGSILGTGSTDVKTNDWQTIEIKCTVNSSKNYTFEVKMDDTTEISVGGASYSNNQCDNIREIIMSPGIFSSAGSDTQKTAFGAFYDDVYLLTTSGGFNNDYIGSTSRVQYLPVNATGNFQNFGIGAGSSVTGILRKIDNGTTFVSGIRPVSGVFDMTSIGTMTTVNGIRHFTQARWQTQSGNMDFVQVTNGSGLEATGIVHAGSGINLDSTYTIRQEIQNYNPATNVAWTTSDINSLQVGVRSNAAS